MRVCVVAMLLVVGCGGGGAHGGDGGGNEPADLHAGNGDSGGNEPADAALGDGGTTDTDAAVPPPGVDWQTGTRLRAEVVRGADEAALFVGWHDSTLDTDCSWSKAESGVVRCTPGIAAFVFADAGCTQPLVSGSGTSPPPYTNHEPYGCGPTMYLKTGAALSPAPSAIYRQYNGVCQGTAFTPVPGVTYYATAQVPATTFLAGTVSRKAHGTTLATDVILGADGSIDSRAVLDVAHGTHCEWNGLGQAQLPTCVPIVQAHNPGIWYTDSTCTTTVAEGGGDDSAQPFCEAPSAIEDGNGLDAIGAQVTPPVYRMSGSTCAEDPSPYPGATFWKVGAPLAANAYAALTYVNKGANRLQLSVATSPNGDVLRGVGFYDTQRSERCFEYTAHDGVVRCMPSDLDDSIYFSDAGCTVPVYANDGGEPPSLFLASVTAPGGYGEAIYMTGARLSDTAPLYLGVPGYCALQSTRTFGGYYAAGPEVPASSFAPVTYAIE